MGGLVQSPSALGLLIAAVLVITVSLVAEFRNKKSELLTHDE